MKKITGRIFFWFFCLSVLVTSCQDEQACIDDPQAGDIYLFEASDTYFPVRVDFVEDKYVYCNNSLYVFEDGLPEAEDMPADEFDYTFHHIYEKSEIQTLYKEQKIVKVYRND
jgi:hypothetical protein